MQPSRKSTIASRKSTLLGRWGLAIFQAASGGLNLLRGVSLSEEDASFIKHALDVRRQTMDAPNHRTRKRSPSTPSVSFR